MQAGVSSTTDYEEYGYDANANITSSRTRAGDTISFTYDPLNRLTRKAVPGGETVDRAYDPAGRLLEITGDWGSLAYAYDSAGRAESEMHDAGDDGQQLRTVGYGYDAASNQTSLTWPDGFAALYEYDALARMTRIQTQPSGGSATELIRFEYDRLSRRTALIRAGGNGAQTDYAYEGDDDLASLSHGFAGGTLAFTYSYNSFGERTGETVSDTQHVLVPDTLGTTNYAVDGLNRYRTVAGEAVLYDANANLTSIGGDVTYTFDKENRLISAGGSALPSAGVDIDYDPLGRRVRLAIVNGATTEFLPSGGDEIAEYDGSGTLQLRYIHGPGIDEPLAALDAAGTIHFVHVDALGTIVAESANTGAAATHYATGPFGMPADPAGTPWRFAGRRLDQATGVYYNRARYYHPSLGRFLSPDPLGAGGGINLYAYAANDPVNLIDPSGLIAERASNAASKAYSVAAPAVGQALADVADFAERNQTEIEIGIIGAAILIDVVTFPSGEGVLLAAAGGAGFRGGVAGLRSAAGLLTRSAKSTKAIPNPGGRLGRQSTRKHVKVVADEMERRGFTITGGGGRLPEEYLPGIGGGRRGSSFVDITATKNGRTVRVNTVDTLKNKVTPTARERSGAGRIRARTPGDHLLLVPKP